VGLHLPRWIVLLGIPSPSVGRPVFDASSNPPFNPHPDRLGDLDFVNLTNVGPQVSLIRDQPGGGADPSSTSA